MVSDVVTQRILRLEWFDDAGLLRQRFWEGCSDRNEDARNQHSSGRPRGLGQALFRKQSVHPAISCKVIEI